MADEKTLKVKFFGTAIKQTIAFPIGFSKAVQNKFVEWTSGETKDVPEKDALRLLEVDSKIVPASELSIEMSKKIGTNYVKDLKNGNYKIQRSFVLDEMKSEEAEEIQESKKSKKY